MPSCKLAQDKQQLLISLSQCSTCEDFKQLMRYLPVEGPELEHSSSSPTSGAPRLVWQTLRYPWETAQEWERSFPAPRYGPSNEPVVKIMRAVMQKVFGNFNWVTACSWSQPTPFAVRVGKWQCMHATMGLQHWLCVEGHHEQAVRICCTGVGHAQHCRGWCCSALLTVLGSAVQYSIGNCEE